MKKLLCASLFVILALSGCEDSGFQDSDPVDASAKIAALEERIAELESILKGVTRLKDPVTEQPTIRFSGVNVQIVNGLEYTNGIDNDRDTYGTVNGLGNLIVGYNEGRYDDNWTTTVDDTNDRTGSHNIIVGSWNSYSSYGGLVVGKWNTISGRYSSVSGGHNNIASYHSSSVTAGHSNQAIAPYASVSGGILNIANANDSSVSGGVGNTASGFRSSVSGGGGRSADGENDWAAGGLFQEN